MTHCDQINQLIELCGKQEKMIDQLTELVKQQKQTIESLTKSNIKTTIRVPYTRLLADNKKIHDLLTDSENSWYCSDDYKKFIKEYHDKLFHPIDKFFDTCSKILIFNMHYVNRIQGFKFESIYHHTISSPEKCGVSFASAIDEYCLGFIVSETDRKYSYCAYKHDYPVNFDQLFTFEIHQKDNCRRYICSQLSNSIDPCSHGDDYADCVLTILQYDD